MQKKYSSIFRKLGSAFFLGNKALLIVLALGAILSICTDTFLTTGNLMNILRQNATVTIVAAGFTVVIACGDLDLSVGSVLCLVGVIISKLMVHVGIPFYLAIPLGIITGMCCSMVNAALILGFKLPAFVVTMAMSNIWKGVVYLITNMQSINNLPRSFVYIGQGRLFGIIPVPVLVMLLMIVLIYILINKTIFGRYVLAMGGNSDAARVCGINTKAVRFGSYATIGFCASIGAVVTTARSASAQIGAGVNIELDSIAAVVIGGTALSGGSANVVGTMFGCLVVGVVNNGLNLLAVDANWQYVAKGMLILVAIVLDSLSTQFYIASRKKQVAI